MRLPLLVLHITGGTLGVLSGYCAAFLRKGSRWHALAGQIFVISMLTMSSCATWLAIMKHEMSNVLGGCLVFYMVLTAWLTARRGERTTSRYDWGALVFIIAITSVQWTYGLEAAFSPTKLKDGSPAPLYLVFGTVSLLAATGDIRMLAAGGLSGTRRLARHLWRMNFALFAAAGSIFLARPHLFPGFMQRTGMLAVLSFLPLALLVFWMIRVRMTKRPISRMYARTQATAALTPASGD